MRLFIKNGLVVDPANHINDVRNILIEDGIIVNNNADVNEAADKTIDAEGLVVMPGFVDLHVHFRDPGFTHKETIETGSMAAAHGGVTSVCTMPNTKPATDCGEVVSYVINEGKKYGYTNIFPVGAITVGQEGKVLTDFKEMKEAGAVALSEDGKSVMDIFLYKEAMKNAAENNLPVMAHCEDRNLVKGGVINAGAKQEELGLPGITNSVEDVITARDIFLAGEAGAALHLCHCSTKGAVWLVRMAKQMGMKVTAEVCPHHFILCDEDIPCDDSMYKMNPPLRSREDKEALIEGLKDGTMEVISTDHAPHSAEEKQKGFSGSPFGIVGLETSFALSYTELVETGILTLSELVEKMSVNPSGIIGIDRGNLGVGKTADICIADISNEYEINPNDFYSMGTNMPYAGRKVKGKILHTVLGGRVVLEDGLIVLPEE
ncbi:MAG: dihydroorotase [Lachnospiraceae bacterium]